jgi:HK97 gp10 family phage protein
MAGNFTFKVDGLKELEGALGELSKAAGRGALRRAGVKAARPLVEMASQLAPKDTGDLSDSIIAVSKMKNTVGNAEFHAVMKSGGSKAEAVSALRKARRDAGGSGSFVLVQIGPKRGTKRQAIKAIVQEFGSVEQPPQPYMRPAFDATKHQIISEIRQSLSVEISKSAERARKRALKLAKG